MRFPAVGCHRNGLPGALVIGVLEKLVEYVVWRLGAACYPDAHLVEPRDSHRLEDSTHILVGSGHSVDDGVERCLRLGCSIRHVRNMPFACCGRQSEPNSRNRSPCPKHSEARRWRNFAPTWREKRVAFTETLGGHRMAWSDGFRRTTRQPNRPTAGRYGFAQPYVQHIFV